MKRSTSLKTIETPAVGQHGNGVHRPNYVLENIMVNKQTTLYLLGSLSVAAALAACDNSQGTSNHSHERNQTADEWADSLCDEITGGDTSVTYTAPPTCIICSEANGDAAIDGDQTSYATVDFTPGTDGPWTITAKAQPGVVYPQGKNAAVVLSAPANLNYMSVTISTYLDGQVQDTDCSQAESIQAGDRVALGITTKTPFDSVELKVRRNNLQTVDNDCGVRVLSFSNPQETLLTEELNLHEFCSAFRVPN